MFKNISTICSVYGCRTEGMYMYKFQTPENNGVDICVWYCDKCFDFMHNEPRLQLTRLIERQNALKSQTRSH